MNKLEKQIMRNFNLKISDAREIQDDLRIDLEYKCKARGGEKSSMERMFDWMMLSCDKQTRQSAMSTMAAYYRQQGIEEILSSMFQEFANKGVNWHE